MLGVPSFFLRLLVQSFLRAISPLSNLMHFSWRRSDMSLATFIKHLSDATIRDRC